jgi:hypothetical protein
MTDLDIYPYIKGKSQTDVAPPGAAPRAVRLLYMADRSDTDTHKTRSVLIPRLQKLFGRVWDATSKRIDSDPHHILNSLY